MYNRGTNKIFKKKPFIANNRIYRKNVHEQAESRT
jgi:hypothetical protein